MSKLLTLRDAVASIHNGTHIGLGGFAITRCVVAAAHEIVRAQKRDLELTQVIGGLDTDLLVGAGLVRRLRYSGGSLDRFGPLHAVNRAIVAGTIEVEEYSSLALTLRLHAGALGLPSVAMSSMLGSALLENLLGQTDDVRLDRDPFTGAPVVILAPLRPDVGFVHADVADERGNAVVRGPSWTIRELALAARRTVVVAEEIVAPDSLDASTVTIPGVFVDAVASVPHAAHPTAVFDRYDYDRAHLEEYVARARSGDSGIRAYLEEFVLGTDEHDDYLSAAGVRV